MDSWLLVGVAVWRLTRMLWVERGPIDMFTRMRAYLAKKQKRMGGLYDLVSCFFCLSVWVSMLPAIFMAKDLLTFILSVLILSGIAVIIHQLIERVK
jgi:hypothetical protein